MKDIITLIELFIAVFIVPTVGMLIGSYVVMVYFHKRIIDCFCL